MIGIHGVNLQYLNLVDTRCGNNGIRTLFLPLNPEGKFLLGRLIPTKWDVMFWLLQVKQMVPMESVQNYVD